MSTDNNADNREKMRLLWRKCAMKLEVLQSQVLNGSS